MRLKIRMKEAKHFLAFAFYPKTTLIACTIFFAIVIAILGIVMTTVPQNSIWYNIIFALTTGAAGSFFFLLLWNWLQIIDIISWRGLSCKSIIQL